MSEVTVCQEYFNYRNYAVDGLFIAPIDDDATVNKSYMILMLIIYIDYWI